MGGGEIGNCGNTVGSVKGSFLSNIEDVKKTYPIDHLGYFGDESNQSSSVRTIKSNNRELTSFDFYAKIAYGGEEIILDNNKGVLSTLVDGTIIVYRPVSSSKDKSPAIQIRFKDIKQLQKNGIKRQKIHFIEE